MKDDKDLFEWQRLMAQESFDNMVKFINLNDEKIVPFKKYRKLNKND